MLGYSTGYVWMIASPVRQHYCLQISELIFMYCLCLVGGEASITRSRFLHHTVFTYR